MSVSASFKKLYFLVIGILALLQQAGQDEQLRCFLSCLQLVQLLDSMTCFHHLLMHSSGCLPQAAAEGSLLVETCIRFDSVCTNLGNQKDKCNLLVGTHCVT